MPPTSSGSIQHVAAAAAADAAAPAAASAAAAAVSIASVAAAAACAAVMPVLPLLLWLQLLLQLQFAAAADPADGTSAEVSDSTSSAWRATDLGAHCVAILASKQSGPGGWFGTAVSCFGAVSCLGMTIASGPTTRWIGRHLKEIRWDGSHVSLAYDTDTQLIPVCLQWQRCGCIVLHWPNGGGFGTELGTFVSHTSWPIVHKYFAAGRTECGKN